MAALVDRLGGPRPWSVKDSFGDLDLHDLGFVPVIDAHWFGGYPASGNTTNISWERVRTPQELACWVAAWDEGADTSPFKNALLSDPRIGFWQSRQDGLVAAGGISFASGAVLGLSNWFARGNETVFDLGLTTAIAKVSPGLPIVLWTDEEVAGFEGGGLSPLSALRIWIAD